MKKIKQWVTGLQDWIDYGINLICNGMSPLTRLLLVLVVGLACGIAFIYIMTVSIYNIGKRDAEKEFLRLQHIESLKLQPQSGKDSINILNQKEYEYEQSNK